MTWGPSHVEPVAAQPMQRRVRGWRALLLAGLVLGLLSCKNAAPGPTSPSPGAAGADAGAPADLIPVGVDDATFGAATAYVTWVVFGDFRSPLCKQLFAGLDRLRDAYPPDQLRVVWKHQPSANLALAKLAATVGQGVFALHGINAFARYRDLAFRESATVTPTVVRQWAMGAGLGAQELDAGLELGAWSGKVDRDMALAAKLAATEAPVSFVNGVRVAGAPPVEVLRNRVDLELAKAKVLEQSGVPRVAIYSQAVAANAADGRSTSGTNELEDPKAVWNVPIGGSPVRGKATASVTIVEFSDFDCAPCRDATRTLDRIRAAYGDTVRFVWKDAPPLSRGRVSPATYLARAARAQKGDDGFWEAHDSLFAHAKLDDVDLEGVGQGAGLDLKAAMGAVHDQSYRKDVETDLELADDVEVTVPPQFFLNGRRIIGDPSYDRIRAIVDEEVQKSNALVRSGMDPAALYDWFIKDGLPGEPIRKSVPLNPNAPFKGLATGSVVVQEFAELPCAACAQADPMLDDLVKAFPSAVKVVWRDLPSVANPNAQLAAEAAREAFAEKGNAGFWKMHAQMATSPSSLARADVEQCGRDSGLDAIKLRTALDARTYRSAVDADAKAAADAGITATPAFVVGPYLLRGAPSFARLSRLVRRVIAEAPAPTPSAPSAGPVRFAVVDLVVGSGPAAERGNEVTIRYRGRLLAGGDVESGSRTFTLGGGSVIQAWNLGVVGMKVGGRRRLTVPPELAYGNHGVGSVIPPKAALVYDVDLVAIH